MVTPDEYMKNLLYVRDNLLDETERIISANEKDIISLNIQKIEDGLGSDGDILKNHNRKFTGRYTLGTNLLNTAKKAGDLYTFFETGSFLGNFQVEVLSNKVQIEIFSTGTGNGDKALFFKGYKNLYGLTKEDKFKLNYEIIYPELMKFINQYI